MRLWQEAGLGAAARAAAGRVTRCRELVWSRAVCNSNQIQAKRGRQDRSEPGRHGPSGLKAPPPDKRRPAAGVGADGRQPPRRHPAAAALVDRVPSVDCHADGPTGSSATAPTTPDGTASSSGGATSSPCRPLQDRARSGLARDRRVGERTIAWLHRRRRPLVRYDRRSDIHEGFVALACCLIGWRRLQNSLYWAL